MAIAIHTSTRHVAHRPPWVRQRGHETNGALPLVVVLLLAVGITGLLLSWQVLDISVPRSLVPSTAQAAQTRPTDGAAPTLAVEATVSQAAAAPASAASPSDEVADAAPEPTALAVGARARVANTDNLGVVLYAAPRDDARQPAGLLEGTAVTVLERSGDAWARVQTDAKKAGWVRAEYLTPAE